MGARLRACLLLTLGVLPAACGDRSRSPDEAELEAGLRPEGGIRDAAQSPDSSPDLGEVDAAPDPDAGPDPDVGPDPDAGPDAAPPCPEGWAESFDPLAEVRLDEAFQIELPICASSQRFAVVARGMSLRLTLDGLPAGMLPGGMLPGGMLVEARDLLGGLLAQGWVAEGERTLSIDWEVTGSGEIRLLVRRPEGRLPGRLMGTLRCVAGCEGEATRYPIVLIHGMAGTDSYFGILEYFYQVPETLAERGFVTFTTVSRFIGSSEDRAAMIADQLDAYLAETGVAKVHLIGHSQGGLDMRVLVSGLGYQDRVASMTTVATPHDGLRIDLPEFLAGMDFSEDYLSGAFRERYPDVGTMPRFSWSGRTCGRLDRACRDANHDEVVELVLAPSFQIVSELYADDGLGGANDGLVPVSISRWGEHLGVIPADHFDEVGQIADRDNPAFDHRAFYLSEARRLRQLEIDQAL